MFIFILKLSSFQIYNFYLIKYFLNFPLNTGPTVLDNSQCTPLERFSYKKQLKLSTMPKYLCSLINLSGKSTKWQIFLRSKAEEFILNSINYLDIVFKRILTFHNSLFEIKNGVNHLKVI